MADHLIVCKTRTYEKDGEEQTAFTRIGVFFPFKEKAGGRIILDDGMIFSGEAILVEPKQRSDAGA